MLDAHRDMLDTSTVEATYTCKEATCTKRGHMHTKRPHAHAQRVSWCCMHAGDCLLHGASHKQQLAIAWEYCLCIKAPVQRCHVQHTFMCVRAQPPVVGICKHTPAQQQPVSKVAAVDFTPLLPTAVAHSQCKTHRAACMRTSTHGTTTHLHVRCKDHLLTISLAHADLVPAGTGSSSHNHVKQRPCCAAGNDTYTKPYSIDLHKRCDSACWACMLLACKAGAKTCYSPADTPVPLIV